MEMRTDPASPIMAGVYLINPTDVDMRHAAKRVAAMHLRPADLTGPNRAVRRRLARRRPHVQP